MIHESMKYEIKDEEYMAKNSSEIQVKPNTNYKITIPIIGYKVGKYSSYIAVIFNDQDNLWKRKIVWIKNSNGELYEEQMVIRTDVSTKWIKIAYRINHETQTQDENIIDLPGINSLKIEEVDSDQKLSFNNFEMMSDIKLTKEDLDNLERKLVWVVGYQRTGSTWLTRDLLKNKLNVLWNEPFIGNLVGIIREWRKDTWGDSSFNHMLSFYYRKIWIKGLRRLILERAHYECLDHDKNVIIKEPAGSVGVDMIFEILPKSKMIFLVRDGRDVVDSLIDAHGKGSFWNSLKPLKSSDDRENAIKEHSVNWKERTELVYKTYLNHNLELKLLVKYEDLRNDTFNQLKKIYDFLNLEIDNRYLEQVIEQSSFEKIPKEDKGSGKFYRVAKPGFWKDNFNNKETKIMNEIMNDILKKLNYVI